MTTYSAQGATVDRAFVMADPSMDKQELYVAASRSREETYLYATPEIQVEREEIAPRSPYLREGIPHIAEAAERDRAQVAAHDVAQLEALPASELIERRGGLRQGRPEKGVRHTDTRSHRGGRAQAALASIERQIENAQGAGRAGRKELPQRWRTHEWVSMGLENRQRNLAELPQPHDLRAIRAELAMIEQVLAERRELTVTAARIAPPDYITKELGERPTDPTKRKVWEYGVEVVEGYRQEHGVKDRGRAFGTKPKEPAERAARKQAQRQLQRLQRDLGKGKQLGRSRDSGRSLGMGR